MVYHVCPGCHTPRSKHYHDRHPVKFGEAIPAPSLCRYCKLRREQYEEVTVTRARGKQASLTPRVDEVESDDERHPNREKDGFITEWREEIRVATPEPPKNSSHHPSHRESHTKIRTTLIVDDSKAAPAESEREPVASSSQKRTPMDIPFRHVSAPQFQNGLPEATKSVPKTATASVQRDHFHASATAWIPPPAPSPPGVASSKGHSSLSSERVREIAREELRRTHMSAAPIAYIPVQPMHHVSITPSEVRRIVKEETGRHSEGASAPVAQSNTKSVSITKSEVGRIAHEQVEKYRRAERAMESHPDAYAHGHIVATVVSQAEDAPPSAIAIHSAMNRNNIRSAAYVSQYTAPGQPIASQVTADTKITAAAASPNARRNDGTEYYYVARTAEVLPGSTSNGQRASEVSPEEVEHVVMAKDVIERWPDETRERHFRGQEVYYGDHIDRRNVFTSATSTVLPGSSISQRPPRVSAPRNEHPSGGHRAQERPKPDHSTAFYGIQEDTKHASRDVLIGHGSELRLGAVASAVTGASMVQHSLHTATDKGPSDKQAHRSHQNVPDSLPERRHSAAGKHHTQPAREEMPLDYEIYKVKQKTYTEERLPPPRPSELSNPQYRRTAERNTWTDTPRRHDFTTAQPASNMTLAQVDERPVGNDLYVREIYTAPPSQDSVDSDKTVWPGYVRDKSGDAQLTRPRAAPLDSLAMHRQHAGERQSRSKQKHFPKPLKEESYIVPKGSVRERPIPPHEKDVIHDDRRYYRDIDPSGERIIEERIVRAVAHSPERRGRHYHTSRADDRPTRAPSHFEEQDYYYRDASSAQPRGILRPPSAVPSSSACGVYSNAAAHVTFASKDNVAPTPVVSPIQKRTEDLSGRRPRAGDFDGPNSSRASTHAHTHDHDRSNHQQRSRPSYRDIEDGRIESITEYEAGKAHVITRALSESPSRERAADVAKKAAQKRVKMEVDSLAHGPYHAEVSPTVSMEVLADGSQVGYEEVSKAASMRDARRAAGGLGRGAREGGGAKVEPGWLWVTKVKQFIDPKGRPYEVVKEEVLLDEEYRGHPRTTASRDVRLD